MMEEEEIMNLIIDTDGGVDDLFAIYHLIHSKKCNILAITCTYGNVKLEGDKYENPFSFQ